MELTAATWQRDVANRVTAAIDAHCPPAHDTLQLALPVQVTLAVALAQALSQVAAPNSSAHLAAVQVCEQLAVPLKSCCSRVRATRHRPARRRSRFRRFRPLALRQSRHPK